MTTSRIHEDRSPGATVTSSPICSRLVSLSLSRVRRKPRDRTSRRIKHHGLTALLHSDATQSMPPYELWLRGHDEIRRWFLGTGIGCRGSRLVPTVANGSPAFGQYRPALEDGHEPWVLQVLEISAGRISADERLP